VLEVSSRRQDQYPFDGLPKVNAKVLHIAGQEMISAGGYSSLKDRNIFGWKIDAGGKGNRYAAEKSTLASRKTTSNSG
jgi:hypothetical protein